MLQIELRIDGQLITFVDVTNIGPLSADNEDDVIRQYKVSGREGRGTIILHDRRDGALKLAAHALRIIDKESKPRKAVSDADKN